MSPLDLRGSLACDLCVLRRCMVCVCVVCVVSIALMTLYYVFSHNHALYALCNVS